MSLAKLIAINVLVSLVVSLVVVLVYHKYFAPQPVTLDVKSFFDLLLLDQKNKP